MVSSENESSEHNAELLLALFTLGINLFVGLMSDVRMCGVTLLKSAFFCVFFVFLIIFLLYTFETFYVLGYLFFYLLFLVTTQIYGNIDERF